MQKSIILLNGPSSSGKSTLAKTLKELIETKTTERIFDQLKERLSLYRLYLIHVTCSLDVLNKREKKRKNRCVGSAESSYKYLFPKDGYDLTVETDILGTKECALKIAEHCIPEFAASKRY